MALCNWLNFFFFLIQGQATLAFASVAKENNEVIVWLKEYPLFSFPLYKVILNK